MTKKEGFLKIIEENPGINSEKIIQLYYGKNVNPAKKKSAQILLSNMKKDKIVYKEGGRGSGFYIKNKKIKIQKQLSEQQENLMNYFKMKDINGITETDENVYIDPVSMISSLIRKVVEQKSANYQMQTSNGEIKPVVDIDSFSTFIQSFMEELDDLAADY